MVNLFYDSKMGRVGQVIEIFSKVGRVTETFSKVGQVTEAISKVGRVTEIFSHPKTFIVSNPLYLL